MAQSGVRKCIVCFTVAVLVVALVVGIPATATATIAPKWAIEHTPNPSGATSSYLNGVSCPSVVSCVAVGHYFPGATFVGMSEVWDGTRWAVKPIAPPSGAEGALLGVSCPSATWCYGVGSYLVSRGAHTALAEQWNGTRWSIQTIPRPSGATSTELSGISCLSATSCTAVGWYGTASEPFVPLAESWNGTSWSVLPGAGVVGEFDGVSCSSAGACMAVGWRIDKTDTLGTLAEHWNGTTWKVAPTPNPPNANSSQLDGVSCPSATECIAVGYDSAHARSSPVVESWNGRIWTISFTPAVSFGTLSGASCSSTTTCTATGEGPKGTLAEGWNGKGWSVQATPNPTGAVGASLEGVSCLPAACMAVGYAAIASRTVTLAERYAR